jgi:hypothetical protein
VLVVIASGNEGLDGTTLDMKSPQNLGRVDNPLITVGGVRADGQYWANTTPERPGSGGSMTLYAQAVNVMGASNTGNAISDVRVDSGTSFAAPAIVCVLLSLSQHTWLLGY